MENLTQRQQAWVIVAVIAAAATVALAFKSILPILIFFTSLAVYDAAMNARKEAKERKGTTDDSH